MPSYRRSRTLILGYKHDVVVPTSSSNALIFPVDRETGKFNMQFYDPAMTKGVVSREEISSFLQELEPMVKPIFNSDVISLLKSYQAMNPYLLIALFLVWLIAAICGVKKGSQYFFILPGATGLYLISLFIVHIINCLAISEVEDFIAESKGKIIPYVQAKNETMREKGFLWVAPANFPYWIELWAEGASIMPVSMEQQYGIPIREEIPSYYPSNYENPFN